MNSFLSTNISNFVRSLLLISFKILPISPPICHLQNPLSLGAYESSKGCKSSLNAQAIVCFVSVHIQNASRRLPELASCQHRRKYLPHKICATLAATERFGRHEQLSADVSKFFFRRCISAKCNAALGLNLPVSYSCST